MHRTAAFNENGMGLAQTTQTVSATMAATIRCPPHETPPLVSAQRSKPKTECKASGTAASGLKVDWRERSVCKKDAHPTNPKANAPPSPSTALTTVALARARQFRDARSASG